MEERSKMGEKIWKFFDDLKLFFKEARNRLNAQTPKFLRAVGTFCAVLAGAGAIPTALTKFGIILPPVWVERLALVVTVAGAVGKAITMFTFSPGQHVELPYTAKKQQEKIEKQIDP